MHDWQDILDNWLFQNILRDGDKNIELMQFTGLKDKNGKEIYEGDIVRYDLGDREAELEGEENRYDYAQIVFYNGQFLTLNHDGATLGEIVCFGQKNQWEVIGNIYENPELIERDTWCCGSPPDESGLCPICREHIN